MIVIIRENLRLLGWSCCIHRILCYYYPFFYFRPAALSIRCSPPPRFFFLSIFFERGLTRSAFILFSFFHFVIFIPFFFSKINFKRFLELTQRVLHNNVITYCVCVFCVPPPTLPSSIASASAASALLIWPFHWISVDWVWKVTPKNQAIWIHFFFFLSVFFIFILLKNFVQIQHHR